MKRWPATALDGAVAVVLWAPMAGAQDGGAELRGIRREVRGGCAGRRAQR